MSTAIKEITPISWDQVISRLPKNGQNQEIINLLNSISNSLDDEDRYAYQIRFAFGDKIIDKGKIPLETFTFKSNGFRKTLDDFKNDIGYSDDPLGIITSNYAEVYTENKSLYDGQKTNYTVPLNVIKAGDLFGVFGTLNYLTGLDGKSKPNRDWYLRAGDISFNIAFPFNNEEVKDYLSEELKYAIDKFKELRPEEKVKFVRDNIGDWHVDVVYIPRHFLKKMIHDHTTKLENLLLKKGWIQSEQLRYALFEDTTIANYFGNKKSLKHEPNFLSLIYTHLIDASNRLSKVYKPLVDGNHIITKALNNYRETNEYFKTSKCFIPLPFIHGRIEGKNDYGLLSVCHLPIVVNYKIESLSLFLKDLRVVARLVKNENSDKLNYLLPDIIGYGNTGGKIYNPKLDDYIEKPIQLKIDFLQKSFTKLTGYDSDSKKINLTSKEFANVILIKGQ